MERLTKREMEILKLILQSASEGRKLFALLLDPEKTALSGLAQRTAGADLVLVGGSTGGGSTPLVEALHAQTELPVVLFPGSIEQFCPTADALLFLSVMSSDNPEMLLHRQIHAARRVYESGIESIATGYILIDGGTESAVARSSGSRPLDRDDIQRIADTATAAELTGKKVIYLEAGSGAKIPVSTDIIRAVRHQISVPLIVGGGICSREMMEAAFEAGADIVVVGNHLEQHPEQIALFTGRKE